MAAREGIALDVRALYERAGYLVARTVRYLPPSVERADLVQAAVLAAIEAAPRYRPGGPASLLTFVAHRMRGAIRDELAAAAPVEIPPAVESAAWDAEPDFGADLTAKEAADLEAYAMGRSAAQIAAARGVTETAIHMSLQSARRRLGGVRE